MNKKPKEQKIEFFFNPDLTPKTIPTTGTKPDNYKQYEKVRALFPVPWRK